MGPPVNWHRKRQRGGAEERGKGGARERVQDGARERGRGSRGGRVGKDVLANAHFG